MMKPEKRLKEDIEFIKKTIEKSGTYSNIPASGYAVSGMLALCACLLTYYRLGIDRLSNIHLIHAQEIIFLATSWALAFVLAVIVVIYTSILNARKNKIRPWSALASRIFLSQIPVVVVAGTLTIALTARGMYALIPAVWLLCYSIIVFSFSYYTGIEHKIQGILFIILGIFSAFMSAFFSLIFLAIGFGGVNIFFGIVRFFRVTGSHGTKETE
jgi:hypothetical protein